MSSTEPVVAQSNLSPASNTQGTPVQARLFKITDIPAAMDAIDWPVSAALIAALPRSPRPAMLSA